MLDSTPSWLSAFVAWLASLSSWLQQSLHLSSPVDLLLLGVLLLYGLDGVRRGFVAGALGLIGLVVTVLAALRWFHAAGELLRARAALPPLVSDAVGFLLVLVVAQVAWAVVARVVHFLLRPLRLLLGPLLVLEHLAGFFPGVLQGLIILALVLTPIELFHVPPGWAGALDRSVVAQAIIQRVQALEPQLAPLVGGMIGAGLAARPSVIDSGGETTIPPQRIFEADPAAELALFSLVNAERVKAGVAPLAWDEQLRQVARQHSAEMFALGYFAHTSPISGSPTDRLQAAGIRYYTAGENLAYAPSVQAAHAGLMASAGHRQNILSAEFTRIGIGVMNAGLGGRMFTQEFAG